MTTITTRSGKGSPLTNDEVDANFTNLNTDKVEASGDSMTGNLSFGDNIKATFGAGDLEVFHDGSHSYVRDSGTGHLKLQGTDVRIQSADGAENFLVADLDGAVRIYNDNAQKLQTTSTGIGITGSVVSDGADIDGAAVFNESGADVDFRIESSQKANMFFLDAGNNRVGVGTGVPDTTLHVTESTAGAMATFESTSANSSGGPNIRLWRNSSTPESGDGLSRLIFQGMNSAAERLDYVEIQTSIEDVTDGTEDGLFRLETYVDGVSRNRLLINSAEAAFNDGGRNLDFRVESDTQSHMLFVDGGNNHVNIGSSADYGGRLNVVTGDNTTTLALVSTDADASVGPKLVLRRDSASPADNDNAGQILFTAENDAGADTTYGFIRATLEDVTDGTEDGILDIQTITAGSTRSRVKVAGAETVINESSQDLDFRVESDTNTHALFVEGDGTGVGINTSNPEEALHVTGTARLDANNTGVTTGDAVNQLIFRDNDTTTGGGQPMGDIDFVTQDSGNEGVSGRIRVAAESASTGDGRMTFSTGRVGTLANNLTMTSTEAAFNQAGADIDFRVESDSNSHMLFVDGGNNRVGIGTSSPANLLDVSGSQGSGGISARVLNTNATSATTYAELKLETGLSTGAIREYSGSGSAGYMAFHNEGTERMRIDSSGNLLVGTTDPTIFDHTTGEGVVIGPNAIQISRSSDQMLLLNRMTTNGLVAGFYAAGVGVGSISVTGSATTYNTSSDQRLKDNIINAPSASDDIDAIQVRSFDWKADGSHQKYGMVAQELQSVAPEAVSEGETEDDMMGVDYSKLVPMLVKEIQSLRARVAQLETN